LWKRQDCHKFCLQIQGAKHETSYGPGYARAMNSQENSTYDARQPLTGGMRRYQAASHSLM
jgi:hypothetical protein